MAQQVGDLVVNLDADSASFKEQIERAKKQLSGFGESADSASIKAREMLNVNAASRGLTTELSRNAEAAKRAGISVGQYNAAMRMLPAQMTDVVTQLAGQQNPLLILIQQGGQIKDSFGGIIPTFQALAATINPVYLGIAVLAGMVGTLTYAIHNNRKEIETASEVARSSLGAGGDLAQKLALNMVAISEKTGEAIDVVAKMFITTTDGATEAFNKLLSVGYSYDEAKKKVESYKVSSNFTALNADIDQHRREVLGIGNAWTDAAIKQKNYYTGADKGKQRPALGGAVDPIVGVIEQAKGLQKTINELRTQGNLEVKKTVDWINKEYLATDRVAGAENRLKEAREQARKIAASGDAAAISNANKLIAAREKEVEEARKQTEPKQRKFVTPAGDKAAEAAQAQKLALQAQLDILIGHKNANDAISQQRKELLQTEAEYNILRKAETALDGRKLSAQEKSLLAHSKETLEYKRQLADLGDKVVMQQKLNSLLDQATKFAQQQSAKRSEIDSASQGLSSREAGRESTRDRLRSVYEGNPEAQQKVLAEQEKTYAAEDALRANWQAGAKSAWAEYADSATNAYSQVQQVGLSALNGLSSQLTTFLTTGKASFKDFTKSILTMLTEILMKMALVKGIEAVGSAFGFGVTANAKGGVYSSASLSSYSGQIVDSPTLFAFAKGAGLMGEAGPEAIMPLTRNANGVLGVRAVGAVGSAAPVVNINIASDGRVSQSSSAGLEQFGGEIGKFVDQRFKTLLQKEMGQGRSLSTAMKGRRG